MKRSDFIYDFKFNKKTDLNSTIRFCFPFILIPLFIEALKCDFNDKFLNGILCDQHFHEYERAASYTKKQKVRDKANDKGERVHSNVLCNVLKNIHSVR